MAEQTDGVTFADDNDNFGHLGRQEPDEKKVVKVNLAP